MEYFIDAFKNYSDFKGRARRKAYWMFMLFYLIFYVACIVLDVMVETGGIIAMVYALVMLVPSVSLAARRLHDTSRSGWWQLLVLIPLIGPIVLIVFLVQDSHDANGFGVNPKLAAQ